MEIGAQEYDLEQDQEQIPVTFSWSHRPVGFG
jgi:hypothetical protein